MFFFGGRPVALKIVLETPFVWFSGYFPRRQQIMRRAAVLFGLGGMNGRLDRSMWTWWWAMRWM